MTQFDILLRRALMDANLAQYEQALQSADAAETEFSPAYLRERTRLLADPQGWEKRRSGPRRRRRLNWKVIAVAAALLLLSACAYAVATGQFSQWFPRLGVDPDAPKTSEELLGRMGTVIEESQTVNGETVTLHAAIWDGETLMLSLTAEVPGLPEKVVPGTFVDFSQCGLEPVEDRQEAYAWEDAKAHGAGKPFTQEELERSAQRWLEEGVLFYPSFSLLSREGTALNFEVRMELKAYLEKTEMTLHLENILAEDEEKIPADIREHGGDVPEGFKADVPVLNGPFDFTFTLGEPVPPAAYEGEIPITVNGVPLRLTGVEISFFEITPVFEVQGPVACGWAAEPGEPVPEPDPNMVDGELIYDTVYAGEMVRGFWTADGGYVGGLSGGSLTFSIIPDSDTTWGFCVVKYPHIVDPATVTAVDIAGTRVELSELERLTDYQEFFKNL